MMGDIQVIREFICENFIVNDEDFTDEDSLLEQGILDSIGVIEIADFIQEKFGIVVTEDDLNVSNLSSVTRIVDFIQKKLAKTVVKKAAS